MSNVFVLDSQKRPLDPIHPGYARWLLSHQKAAVFRRYPFTIILRESTPDVPVQPLRLKIDPGRKTTGLALVNDTTGDVVWAAELMHRGQQERQAPGRPLRGTTEPSPAQDPLSTRAVAESTPQGRLATAFFGEPNRQRLDLGGAPAAAVPDWGIVSRTGQV